MVEIDFKQIWEEFSRLIIFMTDEEIQKIGDRIARATNEYNKVSGFDKLKPFVILVGPAGSNMGRVKYRYRGDIT